MMTEADNTPTAPNPDSTTGERVHALQPTEAPLADTPPARPALPRCASFLASAAVMADAAMDATAQAAGSVDDDQNLLRLLEQSAAAEAAYTAGARAGDDDAVEAAAAQLHAALAAMAGTPAMGMTGMMVKSARLLRALRDGGAGGAMSTSIADADAPVAESLEADLVRLAPNVFTATWRAAAAPVVAAADPLVPLVRDALSANAEFEALVAQRTEDPPGGGVTHAELAHLEHASALAYRIAETPATTSAGLRAKAEVTLYYQRQGADDFGLGASLAQDVLRMSSATITEIG